MLSVWRHTYNGKGRLHYSDMKKSTMFYFREHGTRAFLSSFPDKNRGQAVLGLRLFWEKV